jgi:nitric oxide reductase subunit B
MKPNRYNPADGTLRLTESQVAGWNKIVAHYGKIFREGQPERALQRDILAGESAEDLAAFVTWTAWLSVAKRPEANHSYTNNWPYDEAAGNTATPGAMMWSAASAAALLFFLALILYFQHRYQLSIQDEPNPRYQFDLLRMPLTPSQKATAKYFVVAILLFLVHALLGGKMAHDYADGASFFVSFRQACVTCSASSC